jgi:hypothetical protein
MTLKTDVQEREAPDAILSHNTRRSESQSRVSESYIFLSIIDIKRHTNEA